MEGGEAFFDSQKGDMVERPRGVECRGNVVGLERRARLTKKRIPDFLILLCPVGEEIETKDR